MVRPGVDFAGTVVCLLLEDTAVQHCIVVCFQECWVCECLERVGLVTYGNWFNARAVLGAVPFNWITFLLYGRCFIYSVIPPPDHYSGHNMIEKYIVNIFFIKKNENRIVINFSENT